jgi:hypothetical protein
MVQIAADHGHPEAEMNYRRCFRLLGLWNVARLFIVAVDEEDSFSADRGNADLIASIERLKEQNAECVGPKGE